MMLTPARRKLTVFTLATILGTLSVALGKDAAKQSLPTFAPGEYVPAGLGPKQPRPEIPYPGAARARSLPKGRAVVSLLVDADDRVVDSLVTSCTDPIFGKALQDYLPNMTFRAARFKGTAVPARYALSYEFESGGLNTNMIDQASMLPGKFGSVEMAVASHTERELDHPLELASLALPELPVGYAAANGNPPEVVVTFFVDETGHARLPNVEAAASPVLIPGAIAAVARWTFKPATIKGKPALVLAARPVRFLLPEPAKP
jgi:hypothetical protein